MRTSERKTKSVNNQGTKAKRYYLKELLKLSGVARSTYYYYLKQKDVDKYESVKANILELFNKHNCRYGYRRITIDLKEMGYSINHKTVLRLMNELGLKTKQGKNGKYHSYKGTIGKVADNLLKRNFKADKFTINGSILFTNNYKITFINSCEIH